VLARHFATSPIGLVADTQNWSDAPAQNFLTQLRDEATSVDRPLIEDLIAKLSWPHVAFEDRFSVSTPITLVPRSTVDAIYAPQPGDGPEDASRRFAAQFPGLSPPVNLFRIGYNRDRSRALVYARLGPCGGTCGSIAVTSVRFDGKAWIFEQDWYFVIS
jgi:hypothetical protein